MTTPKSRLSTFLTDASVNPRFLKFLLLLISISAGAGFFIMLFLRLKLVGTVNSDIGGVEQNVIYGLQQMLNGRPLYMDPGDFPFYINQYTPLYHYLCYGTALLFHTGPGNIHQLYLIGRSWTLLFNLLSMIALAAIARRFLNLPATLAITVACCSFIFIYRQGFCARADSMLDACALWSVYYFLYYLVAAEKSTRVLFIALTLSFLSVFIKQSGIQFPIIFLGFLLFNSTFKTFLSSLGWVVLLFILLFSAGILIYQTSFIKNVVGGVDNGMSYLWVKNFLWGDGLKTKVILPAAICGYILFVRFRLFKGTPAERFMAMCLLGVFLFNAVISFKAGSNIQYFYVFTNLSLLYIIYYFFGRYYQDDRLKGIYRHVAAACSVGLLFLLMLANLVHQFKWIKLVEFEQKEIINAKEDTAARVANYVKSQNTGNAWVFANLDNEREDLSFSGRRCINNILFSTCAVPGLDVLDISTVKSKVFGYSNFEKYMQNGKIRYMIEGSPNKSGIPGLEELRDRYFKSIRVIGGYTIYRHID